MVYSTPPARRTRDTAKTAGRAKDVRTRRSQEERTAHTRASLIQAAIDVLDEVGFTKTTSMRIAKKANVSRGAFQHQFGTVQNLMLEVVNHLSSELVGQIEVEMTKFASPAERLAVIATRYWEVYQSVAYRAVLLIWIGSVHDRELVERVDALMRSIDEERDRKWKEVFADIQVPERELAMFRRMLLAMVRGLAMQSIYSKHKIDFDQMLDMVVRLWDQLVSQPKVGRDCRS